jgi:phosphoglycolate phosphatase/pyrophosphatase PpaX
LRYRGILFDLDGTLGDTLPFCVATFQEALAPFAGRSLAAAEITATFGPSEEGTVRALVPEHYEAGLAAYLERYAALHERCPEPFAGVRELLVLLRGAGVRIGIVTGKGPRSAAITLARFALGIADVETGSPDGPCKVAGIRTLVARWALAPERVLYVGDSVSDVHAAEQAGVAVVGAAWASTADGPALRATGAEVFTDIAAFATWLRSPPETAGS